MRKIQKSGWAFIAVLAGLFITVAWIPAMAQYKDVIEMPVVKTDSARYALAVDIAWAGERMVAVGERGHVLYSDDQGTTWIQADVDTRSQLNAVFFINDQKGWAVGEDAVILHTVDAGKTWTRQFDDRDAASKGPLLDIFFMDENTGFSVGVYNKILKTVDGGKTWTDWYDHVDNIDEWHLFNIAIAKSGAIYIGSEQGLLFKSVDKGNSFAPVQTDHIGSFPGIIARTKAGQDQILAFGPGGALWSSKDSGSTWNHLDPGTLAGLLGGVWLEDGTAVIVGHEGTILKVSADLSSVGLHPHESGLPFAGAVPASSEKIVVVGFGGPQVIDSPKAE